MPGDEEMLGTKDNIKEFKKLGEKWWKKAGNRDRSRLTAKEHIYKNVAVVM